MIRRRGVVTDDRALRGEQKPGEQSRLGPMDMSGKCHGKEDNRQADTNREQTASPEIRPENDLRSAQHIEGKWQALTGQLILEQGDPAAHGEIPEGEIRILVLSREEGATVEEALSDIEEDHRNEEDPECPRRARRHSPP